MPINEKQREDRRRGIGASDVPVICGYGPTRQDGTPYKNRHTLYLEKTGKLEPEKETSEAANWGNILEPTILDLTGQTLNTRVKKSDAKGRALEFAKVFSGIPFIVHPDGLALDIESSPMESKSTGLINPYAPCEVWIDPKEQIDGVPHHVDLQAHAQMITMGKEVCYVGALLTGMKLWVYEIQLNPTIRDFIIEQCADFWINNVQKDIPPVECVPMDVIKRIKRVPKKTISIPSSLIMEYQDKRTQRLEAEKIENAAKEALLSALGDAESAETKDGLKCTYFKQKRTYAPTEARTIESPVLRFPKS